VRAAIDATGTTVTTAGLILCGTFAVLAFAGGGSGGGQIQQIGYGVAFGVVMDTFLVRTILVPAFVVLFGRWNWWPSTLSHRAVAVAEVAEASGARDDRAEPPPGDKEGQRPKKRVEADVWVLPTTDMKHDRPHHQDKKTGRGHRGQPRQGPNQRR
jgi:RND superfamily putative drug exporter